MARRASTATVATESDVASSQPPLPDENNENTAAAQDTDTGIVTGQDRDGSVAHSTSTVTAVMEPNDTSSQYTRKDGNNEGESTVTVQDTVAARIIDNDTHDTPVLILQLKTRKYSQEQLIAEARGIYAGLVMVEDKCIEVDNTLNLPKMKLNNEQWQALVALHCTLLKEHYDFFVATQDPSAAWPLKRLANKYEMPVRMWKHSVHALLEILRHGLPASLDHMITFIYLQYVMFGVLGENETMRPFHMTWAECRGDIARYR